LNEFDFFTADFDEELTALNGDLLFNQIDFVNDCIKHILSLYSGEKGQKVRLMLKNKKNSENFKHSKLSIDILSLLLFLLANSCFLVPAEH
jgi:hypothetical protein